jgi:hypothetical protein
LVCVVVKIGEGERGTHNAKYVLGVTLDGKKFFRLKLDGFQLTGLGAHS